MKILSLDMASKKTGYAYFNNEELIDYGLWDITANNEKDWRKRLVLMAQFIAEYYHTHDIDIIYAEDVPPIQQNTQTVKILSALQGLLIAFGVANNTEIYYVPVSTWKTKVGINLTHSAEAKDLERRVRASFPKKTISKNVEKAKGWLKGWEKKLSVEYANKHYNLQLTYKSPSSKHNQDDIADAINIGHSQICKNVEKYSGASFTAICNQLYNSLMG